MSSSSRAGAAEPATLEQRLRAVRGRRLASRVSIGTVWALWIAGLAALLVVVGAGLLTFH